MATDEIQVIDRKLGRLFSEHVSRLSVALDKALSGIVPNRPSSIEESYRTLKDETFKAIEAYCYEIRQHLSAMLDDLSRSADGDFNDHVLTLVAKYLDEDTYSSRIVVYEAAVERHLARYGLQHKLGEYRADLVWALYKVGVANKLRGTIAEIEDDLELRRLKAQTAKSNAISSPSTEDDKIEMANKVLKVEPNIFGFGFNLNNLLRILRGRK